MLDVQTNSLTQLWIFFFPLPSSSAFPIFSPRFSGENFKHSKIAVSTQFSRRFRA